MEGGSKGEGTPGMEKGGRVSVLQGLREGVRVRGRDGREGGREG